MCLVSGSTGRGLHPRHGTHNPTTSTPARAAASLRRTTTVDLLRPGGAGGEVIVDGRGRDLVTVPDSTAPAGSAVVIAAAAVRARIDYPDNCRLTAIEVDPAEPGAERLLGATVGPGFRAKVGAAVPEAASSRALAHLLLDDLPGAVLVSGYALQADAGFVDMRADAARGFIAGRIDLCSGFRRDGTMLVELDATGRMPMPTGPPAPSLEVAAREQANDELADDQLAKDELAWHAHADLPVGGIRRRRRLDLTLAADRVRIDAMFRDSHVDGSGAETVIHEYTLDALIDRAQSRVLAIEATPRVLPWTECPVAAASAQALVGQTVGDLRTWVRKQLTGIATCTHLNDLLRSLADVDHLVLALDQAT